MLDGRGFFVLFCFFFYFRWIEIFVPSYYHHNDPAKIIILEAERVSHQAIVGPLMPELDCLAENHISV